MSMTLRLTPETEIELQKICDKYLIVTKSKAIIQIIEDYLPLLAEKARLQKELDLLTFKHRNLFSLLDEKRKAEEKLQAFLQEQ